uniref:Ubiquitin-like domain-containing protein n=1 Tax=Pyxicephalus adspersus TaxID=30357 RepID=A0AAV3AZT1_PYXAD|nr:TPA: hypothetical protein GDO54_007125 [Pyxicephalus adspersus]
MEHPVEPSESTDVGLQTDDENKEVDGSEDMVSSVRDEAAFQEQDQNNHSVGVQSMDQQSHANNEESPDMPDLHSSQEIIGTGDEPLASDMSGEKEHKQEDESTPTKDGKDPAMAGQLQIGDQTTSEFSAELPETEQVPEATQKGHIQIINDTKAEDVSVTMKEEEKTNTEKDTFEKKISSDISSPTATVKVMLVPVGQVVTIAFSIGNSVGNLKNDFASQMKIPERVIQITFEGRTVEDQETLVDLGITPHGTIQLDMHSTDPENFPIKAMTFQHEYSMPDVITVRVQTGEDAFQDIAVEIERLNYRKPYLGGYRHKLTGAVYHHAGTQTVPKKRPDRGVEVFCRETQTVNEKNKTQQSRNTMSTQMTKIGYYVSNITDKLIQPSKYVTADEYHARRLKAVIVIQTYFRRFYAKKVVEQLREEKKLRLEWEEREELRKEEEKKERLRKDYERRMNPKTKEDFELLYHALELWRKEGVERINHQYTGAERKAALCALLEQETQLISSIGRHKLDSGEENQEKAIQSLLNKCCEPKKWKAFDGRVTEMDTQFTIRARELRDIYNSINTQYFTRDERLDALLTLKHTVKQEDLQYLVENIWAPQSVLSACDDLYDLVIVRWDKYYEWSPWNCILLTKDEAAAHLKLGNAEQAYGIVFIRKIKHRHTLAKNYFSQIPEMAPFLHREKSNQMSAVNDLLCISAINIF